MKRTEPSKHLYAGHAYVPSWMHVPRTTWLDRLGGHFGLCPAVAERNAATPAVLAVVAALLLSACAHTRYLPACGRCLPPGLNCHTHPEQCR
jgi:hypothetical protein